MAKLQATNKNSSQDKLHILYSQEEIRKQVAIVAEQIKADIVDDEPIVFVCVLKGAFMFFSDLVQQFNQTNVVASFITLSSYEGGTESRGKVNLVQDLKDSVENKHVVIVEDIIDSGRTIEYLRDYFADKKTKSVKTVCLLDKPLRRVVNVSCDYKAFTMKTDKFVIGYGLDYNQYFRNLPNIYYVDSEQDLIDV